MFTFTFGGVFLFNPTHQFLQPGFKRPAPSAKIYEVCI